MECLWLGADVFNSIICFYTLYISYWNLSFWPICCQVKISYKRAWCTVCYLYNKQQVTKLISKCLFVTLCKVFESRPTGTRMIDGYGTGVRYRPIPRSPGIGVGTGKVVPLHPFSEHPVIERYQSLRIFASLRGSRTWTIRWILTGWDTPAS